MKKRLVVPLVVLAISFAIPTYAQQKDLADPQATQKILADVKALAEATNNNDAVAIAAFFTRDAVLVTTEGPIIGRQAIRKWFTDLFQWWHPKNHISKVDGNAVHLIGTGGNELWATGEWSETGQDKNGEPLPIKGCWSSIPVREGDNWKIRALATDTTPDSVILINKSFAPQPAATPSPTASPSTQKDLAAPQTTQKILALMNAIDEAANNNDPAARAAPFTRDAVFVTAGGPIIGRQAIQTWFTDLYQRWHVKNHIEWKTDGNVVHLIGTAGNEVWATGEWSETGQGKTGEPITIKGYWLEILVREGDDWKIRMEGGNATPDSVMRIHQSFAQQPAATPSPTASPSNQ